MEVGAVSENEMLQNNHDYPQQKQTLSPRINNLPSLCENQQQARCPPQAARNIGRLAEISSRSRY
jgi:hypothetical protein